jgi:hypothetical protein
MRVACVIMQRREAGGLEPWPRYHGCLFGYSGLFVMEPLSDDPAVLSLYGGSISPGRSIFRSRSTATRFCHP